MTEIQPMKKKDQLKLFVALTLLGAVIILGGFLLWQQRPAPAPTTAAELTHCDYGVLGIFIKLKIGTNVDPDLQALRIGLNEQAPEIVVRQATWHSIKADGRPPKPITKLDEMHERGVEPHIERYLVQGFGDFIRSPQSPLMTTRVNQWVTDKTPLCILRNRDQPAFILVLPVSND